MTYFGFLLRFLVPPLLLATAIVVLDRRRGKPLPVSLRGWSPWAALLVHVLLAVGYTTPWDNYLVATGVWWYEPELVTGLTIGWVPIEEYTFFVLQTLLAGMALIALAARLVDPAPLVGGASVRRIAPALLGLPWLGAAAVLWTGWQPGAYLGLELVWALPPIMLQLAFGADIIWRQRRLVLTLLLGLTLYLAAADMLAIGAGTWTINPAASTGIMLLDGLPMEELIFFILTNTLVVFGMTLAIAEDSQARLRALAQSFRRWSQAGRPL
jgi:lycopene cyclase domain-containing protein